ncbi:angiopoietin-related protein 4 [Denticeps clupeoides]|uniref:Fibrinogen C-terminal domain-containing protein n=1 Tax=Denticeps clupeoides TaxID=299321 RepID=A0AAY4AIN1_9TELE|nr:angiopoietin-related protein 4-like [Denticeps clupeoides]
MKFTPEKLMACAAVVCVVATTGTAFPFERKSSAGKEKRVQYAAWDDVNVLAHGLLQLGQGLKEHVDKTKGQMRDIMAKLKSFNGTVAELGKQTQQLSEDSQVLKSRAQGLEDRESQVLNVSSELREKAEELLGERRQVHDRMDKLEEKVDGMLQGEGNVSDARVIQLMLEAQNRRIDDLVERIRQQQEKLEKQNGRIRALQNQIQVSGRSPPRRSGEEGRPQNGGAEQGDSPAEMAADCHELFLRGETSSGVYTVQPKDSQPFDVFCEMTNEGGWTVIQRRQDGSVDFDQLWQAYQNGFGNLNGEFWLGLERIHALSRAGDRVLKIQISDWTDKAESVSYPFRLSGEESNYTLRILDAPAGTLGRALATDPSGLPFSTRDKDNDQKSDINCAQHLSGGWWFSSCGRSNLNGRYFLTPPPKQRHQRKQGVFWKTWHGRYYPLKTTAMMVGPPEIEATRGAL